MKAKEKRYITNDRGEKVGVILDMEDFEKMLEDTEELESIRAYDAAKASEDEAIPFEQAVDEIEKTRK
jgi:PHD/YefM family antitoxin component YafN of YafNO toxin-antitoxin module